MICSMNIKDLAAYTSKQLNSFYPDNEPVDLQLHQAGVETALKRLEYCFSKIILKHYFDNGEAKFNHLHSDHYVMYLWFLANTLWKEGAPVSVCHKLYYLNKSLHGFDCMFDTALPDIFIIVHGVGTMLGKATYSNYFVVFHGCTVGINKGVYPEIGEGVTLTAHSSVIGNCRVGNYSTVGNNTGIVDIDISDTSVAYRNKSGEIEIRKSSYAYFQNYFDMETRK